VLKFIVKFVFQSQIIAILGFLSTLLLARALTPESRGVLAIAILLPQLFSRFTTLGFEQYILMNPEIYSRDKYFFASIYNNILALVIFFFIVVLVQIDLVIVFPIIASSVLINFLRIKIAFLTKNEEIKKIFVVNAWQSITYIILILIFKESNNYIYFFFSWFFALLVAVAIYSYPIKLPKLVNLQILAREINSKTFLSSPSWLIEVFFLFGLEIVVLRILYSDELIGHYTVAKGFSLLYYQILSTFFMYKAKINARLRFPEVLAMFMIGCILGGAAYYLIEPLFGNLYTDAREWIPISFITAFLVGIFQVRLISLKKRNQFIAPTIFVVVILTSLLFSLPPFLIVLLPFAISIAMTFIWDK
jgi:O-antigen/teichoic acid export membrane protein